MTKNSSQQNLINQMTSRDVFSNNPLMFPATLSPFCQSGSHLMSAWRTVAEALCDKAVHQIRDQLVVQKTNVNQRGSFASFARTLGLFLAFPLANRDIFVFVVFKVANDFSKLDLCEGGSVSTDPQQWHWDKSLPHLEFYICLSVRTSLKICTLLSLILIK